LQIEVSGHGLADADATNELTYQTARSETLYILMANQATKEMLPDVERINVKWLWPKEAGLPHRPNP
jgi:hypothetical protein